MLVFCLQLWRVAIQSLSFRSSKWDVCEKLESRSYSFYGQQLQRFTGFSFYKLFSEPELHHDTAILVVIESMLWHAG